MSKAVAIHASALEAVAKKTEISADQISETIENWDVQACGQRVFVARLKHETTRGGLYIPDEYQEQQCDGVVISAGAMAYVNDVEPPEGCTATGDDLDVVTRRKLRAGDKVTFGKWSGDTVSRKGSVKRGLDTLMVMNDDQIIGIPKDVK
jgi:co-chaperonin GroES (HSP10)